MIILFIAGFSMRNNKLKIPVLEVKNVKMHFSARRDFFSRTSNIIRAVDGLNIKIYEGETLGLVGESGCGKTTTGRLILQLLEPTEGTILYNGKNTSDFDPTEVREFQREVQMIFQNPFASINPRKTIKQTLRKPFLIQGFNKEEITGNVNRLLKEIELLPPEKFQNRYAHELSGGQVQRVTIARAIALNPKLIVADEPVSALDLSVRAQILNLMKDLQKKFTISILFITHDLSVVRSVTQRVAVMYLGKIVESAKVDELFNNPIHPYTKGLLAATPIPNPRKARSRKRNIILGEIPSHTEIPSGCRFHPRCPILQERTRNGFSCREVEPELVDHGDNHFVACSL